MGYWQWISLGLFVIPMLGILVVDGILMWMFNREERQLSKIDVHSSEFDGMKFVDGIRGQAHNE